MGVPEVELQQEVGRLVRAAREAAGLDQVALARMIKMPQGTISSIETGAFMPSLKKLAAIAEGLGVPLASLIPGYGAPADIRRLLRYPDQVVLYGGQQLTDDEKERLVTVLDATLQYQPGARQTEKTESPTLSNFRQESTAEERMGETPAQDLARWQEAHGFGVGAAQMNQPYEWTWEEAAELKAEMLRVRRLLDRIAARGEDPSGEIGLPDSREKELGENGAQGRRRPGT